jgi:hypothetical protein
LTETKVKASDVALFNPQSALQDKYLTCGSAFASFEYYLMVFEQLANLTGTGQRYNYFGLSFWQYCCFIVNLPEI